MNDKTIHPTEPSNQPASGALPVDLDKLTPEQQRGLLDALWIKLYDEKTAAPDQPIELDKLTDDQLIELGKRAFWKASDRIEANENAKQARIDELHAEIARLEGNTQAADEPPQESLVERIANAITPDPDPADDPYPWFKSFGTTRIRPFEKHLLGEAALVVGQLAYQGIINLIPPKPLQGYDASDDLCDAIRQISGAMWLVRHEFRLGEIKPETPTEYDDPLDAAKSAEPASDESEAE